MSSLIINNTAATTNHPSHPLTTLFEVNVSKETFKFNAAHFVAYRGYRERLHGHNYRVSVRLLGSRKIGPDGYVLDYGCVKKVAKEVCKELNEHFLCPMLSDVMTIKEDDQSVTITCEDGALFVFPRGDCAMLPLVHATTEELAIYLWGRILKGLDGDFLLKRGVHTMEVTVAEAIGQEAVFRMNIPEAKSEGFEKVFDVSGYIMGNEIPTSGCPSALEERQEGEFMNKFSTDGKKETGTNGDDCKFCTKCRSKLSDRLKVLSEEINAGKFELNVENLEHALLGKTNGNK